MNNSIKPFKLIKGDTVGIISPSAPVTENLKLQFNKGVGYLEHLGLQVKLAPHVFDKYYYSAGTRDDRLSDIHSMWENDEIKMVMMTMGGTSATQLLDGIDYATISKHPKIFSGISDGTVLLNALFAKTNIVTYHGPDLLFTFGRNITQLMRQNIIETLFKGKVSHLKQNPYWKHANSSNVSYNGWKWIREGTASGDLVGGHSFCFSQLLMTGYGPDVTGKILFLEGTETIDDLDREFSSLRLNGVFKKITGLVLGWFDGSTLEDKTQNRSVSDTILEITKDYSFPILQIGELGHNVENFVLPIGCQATISSKENKFTIDESTVI